jgi:hypothetical protein
MSQEEKGQWVYLVVILLTYTAYVALVLGQAADTPLTDVAYVPLMLGAIGIGIALSIAGRIVLEIVGPRGSEPADVRDRDIDRFGEYFAGTVLGIAMIVPFVLTLAEFDHFWIANAIYLAFVIAAVIGASMKLVAYRRGM